MAWMIPLIEGFGTGAGLGILGNLFGSDDDSSSGDSEAMADASKYSSKLNLIGTLASALATSQKKEQSASTSYGTEFGQGVDTPSLGNSSTTSTSYPFTVANQYSNSDASLAKTLKSLLGSYS